MSSSSSSDQGEVIADEAARQYRVEQGLEEDKKEPDLDNLTTNERRLLDKCEITDEKSKEVEAELRAARTASKKAVEAEAKLCHFYLDYMSGEDDLKLNLHIKDTKVRQKLNADKAAEVHTGLRQEILNNRTEANVLRREVRETEGVNKELEISILEDQLLDYKTQTEAQVWYIELLEPAVDNANPAQPEVEDAERQRLLKQWLKTHEETKNNVLGRAKGVKEVIESLETVAGQAREGSEGNERSATVYPAPPPPQRRHLHRQQQRQRE